MSYTVESSAISIAMPAHRRYGSPGASVIHSEVMQFEDLSPIVLKQVEDFFVNYQRVREIEVIPLGREGPDSAKQLLEKARTKTSHDSGHGR